MFNVYIFSEIIAYMAYAMTKIRDINTSNHELQDECCHCGCTCKSTVRDSREKEKEISKNQYKIGLQDKKYPSCYQYNVLIMLAKRLIKEDKEQEAVSQCVNRWHLDRKLARAIVNA